MRITIDCLRSKKWPSGWTTLKKSAVPRNCYMPLAFLNATAAADCRYEISLGDLEVIDPLSSSFIPVLSGVVVVISLACITTDPSEVKFDERSLS